MEKMDRLMVGFCTLCGQQYEKKSLDEKKNGHECPQLTLPGMERQD